MNLSPRALTAVLPLLAATLAACSSSSSSPPTPDAAGHDGGARDTGAKDAPAKDVSVKDATHPKDAGKDATTGADAGDATGPVGLTCGGLIGCDQACTSASCTNGCYAKATGTAQGLFDAFDACLNVACPSTPGSVCADAGASACGSCQSSAATGACISRLLACTGDAVTGPPDPDGGSVVMIDAGSPPDAGAVLNCGELTMCEGACDAGASCAAACVSHSTPTAQSLANALEHCLATTCPAGDGGVCDTAGSACTGCRTQAEFDNATCGMPFSTCQSDTSNSGDAGTGPVALQGGTVVTLAHGLDQPQVVLIQGGAVYYSQIQSNGPVSKVELVDGGATPTNLVPHEPYPMGLAIDDTNVYAWNSGSFSGSTTINNSDGTVVQIPLNGATPTTLATGLEVAYAAPYLNAIAVHAGHLYWVVGANGSDGAIMTTAVGSASPTAVYTNQEFPEAVATDGTNLYWANWGTFSPSGAYNNDGKVLQGPIHGGTVKTLASGLSAPAAIAVDGTNVYWTNAGQLGADNLPAPGTGSVMQVPIGGGTVVTLSSHVAIPLDIVVASGQVYWNEYTLSAPGRIVSAPVGGGTLVPLVAGLANPFGIALSGKLLVWSDSPPTQAGSGKILAVTLP